MLLGSCSMFALSLEDLQEVRGQIGLSFIVEVYIENSLCAIILKHD